MLALSFDWFCVGIFFLTFSLGLFLRADIPINCRFSCFFSGRRVNKLLVFIAWNDPVYSDLAPYARSVCMHVVW